jgi:hypothetical protein
MRPKLFDYAIVESIIPTRKRKHDSLDTNLFDANQSQPTPKRRRTETKSEKQKTSPSSHIHIQKQLKRTPNRI